VHKSLRIKGQCAERVRTATNHDDDRNQHCLDPRTAWRIRADTCGFAERSDGEPTRQPPFAFARKAGKLCRAAIAEMVHVKHRRSDAQTVPSLQARDFQRNAQADFDSVPTTMPVPKGLPGGEHRRDGRVGCIWLGSIERLARSLRLNPRWMYSLSDAGPKQLTAPKAPTCGLGTRNCPQDCGCPRCPQAVCGQMGCRFESFLWLITARTRSARCWLELRNLCKGWSNSSAPARQPIVGPIMLMSACPREIR
jgi:hypothetical protein